MFKAFITSISVLISIPYFTWARPLRNCLNLNLCLYPLKTLMHFDVSLQTLWDSRCNFLHSPEKPSIWLTRLSANSVGNLDLSVNLPNIWEIYPFVLSTMMDGTFLWILILLLTGNPTFSSRVFFFVTKFSLSRFRSDEPN